LCPPVCPRGRISWARSYGAHGALAQDADAGGLCELETDRVRRIQDRTAPKYDRQIGLFERVLFTGGREWVCSHAEVTSSSSRW